MHQNMFLSKSFIFGIAVDIANFIVVLNFNIFRPMQEEGVIAEFVSSVWSVICLKIDQLAFLKSKFVALFLIIFILTQKITKLDLVR